MKHCIITLTLILITNGLICAQDQTKSAGNLVWSDEFNGTGAPDEQYWERLSYNRRNNDNGPDGWWSEEDAYLDGNGNLIIRVRKIDNKNDDNDPYDYSCGNVRTKEKFEQTYGKFEMRAKLPTQPGWWVAFWMMQGNVSSTANEGVDGSEVDIMEGWGWIERINHAVHWDGYGDAHQSTGIKVDVPGLLEGFHTYTLEWYPDKYVFFIDGKETWRTTGGGVCNQPGYIKITGELWTVDWAISDGWAGNPEDAVYPDSFIVDYVRVYEFPEGRQPYNGTPTPVPGKIEAEDYDHGDNRDAYYDLTPGNSGSAYRVDDGDIEAAGDGGFNVGWIESGEWMEYTIQIDKTGTYAMDLFTSSESEEGSVQLDLDGEDISGIIDLPVTGDWQLFQTTTANEILLEQGEHVLRVNMITGGSNLDYLDFYPEHIAMDLNGISKKKSYEINVPIEIDVTAYSIAGRVSSIGLFLDTDSIRGATDSLFTISYTPLEEETGWHTFLISVRDDNNNLLQYPVEVFFGNLPPVIEFDEQTMDTITVGDGSTLLVYITDPENQLDSVHVSLSNYEKSFPEAPGSIELVIDTLAHGMYTTIIEAFDVQGNQAKDSFSFVVVLPPNVPPAIGIVTPSDQSVLYTGAGNTAIIEVSDDDGVIVDYNLYVNGIQFSEMADNQLQFDISSLEKGSYELLATTVDDRGGTDSMYVMIEVIDSIVKENDWTLYLKNGAKATFPGDASDIEIYVEKVTGTLSDIQLLYEMKESSTTNPATYEIRFKGLADRYCEISAAIKDDLFATDTMHSQTLELYMYNSEYLIPAITEDQVLSLYIGYRKDVHIQLSDFSIEEALAKSRNTFSYVREPFPNPFSEILYIDYTGTYQLVSMEGKLIKSGFCRGSIALQDISAGLYFLKTGEKIFKVAKY